LAQTGVPNFADKNPGEQVALFSKLIMENSQKPTSRLWRKLDPLAHYVILSELGCLDRNERARHDDWARKILAELKKHARRLGRFFEQQEEHEDQLICHYRSLHPGLSFKLPRGRVNLKTVVESEINELNRLVAAMNRLRKPRGKWGAGRMALAQEYVRQRVAVLGISGSHRLTPAAIADIYHLTIGTSHGDDNPDTTESVRKAIAYFRRNPENVHSIEKIGLYLAKWVPSSRERSIRKIDTLKINV
jgi:hypothetical protein